MAFELKFLIKNTEAAKEILLGAFELGAWRASGGAVMIFRFFKRARFSCVISLAIVAGGCGIADGALRKPNGGDDAKGSAPGPNGDATSTTGSVVGLVMYPPKDYYEFLLASAFDQVDRDQIVNRFALPQSIWVNFEGGTVPRGYLPGQSYLVCGPAAVIPPLGSSPSEQSEVVKKVQELFTSVGANLTVSSSKPSVGEFTTIYVGGSHIDLGCPEAKGRLAVAPFDPGNVNRADVGFVFSAAASSPLALAQIIARTAGHSFGLDQVSNPQDIMYALGVSPNAAFAVSPLSGGMAVQDAPLILRQVLTTPWIGNSSPMTPAAPAFPQPPLYMPGIGYVPVGIPVVPGILPLATLSQLTSTLGASQIVDISGLNGLIRSIFPQTSNQTSLAGFERVATVMALVTRAATTPQSKAPLWGGENGTEYGTTELNIVDDELNLTEKGKGGNTPPTPAPGPGGLFIDGAAVYQYLQAQSGTQLTLDKLAAAAGFPNLDSAIKGIQQGLASGALKMPSENEFSDLTAVFNLSQTVTNSPVLISGYWSSAYYVKGLLTGLNQTSLNAALKIAYIQGLKRLSAAGGR